MLYINRKDVAAALNSLVYSSRTDGVGALEHLLLVELGINAPDMPASDEARAYIVRELLTSLITDAFNEQRQLHNMAIPDARQRRNDMIAAIGADAANGALELLAWSTLYHRYVRADLDLSVDALARLYGVDARTINRYLNYGIRLLTWRLIGAEQAARRDQRRRWLLAVLPYSVPLRLYGRERLLKQVEITLRESSPRHLAITGAPGIGKTAFTVEVVQRAIARDELDQIVWIDEPISSQYVRERLAEVLLDEDRAISLREYLLVYRIAIVLDGIEAAVADRGAFDALLRDLGAAFVCLISRSDATLEIVPARANLPELDADAALKLLEEALLSQNQGDSSDWREFAGDLYDRFGGNPLVLKLAVGLPEYSSWESLEGAVHEQLFGRVFERLGEGERRAWYMLALFPAQATLSSLVAWGAVPEQVDTLARHHLLESEQHGVYSLIGSARRYVVYLYEHFPEVAETLRELVLLSVENALSLDVVEQALVTGFPDLGSEWRLKAVSAFWEEGLRQGHWAQWRVILEDAIQGSPEPMLRIAYGICLRRLADWTGAQAVFLAAAAECGRMGQFGAQARAFLEWGILSKCQGDYSQSLALLGQVKRYAERGRDPQLLRSVALQEAQILIQQGDGAKAYTLLSNLPGLAQVLAMQSEAQLVIGNVELSRTLAERALAVVADDRVTEASLHTIIGRTYQVEQDYEQAHRSFAAAARLLEWVNDPFSLARARTNLAAVLIPLGRRMDAANMLSQAEMVQSALGDRVGLMATRHNRSIIGRL